MVCQNQKKNDELLSSFYEEKEKVILQIFIMLNHFS